MIMCSPTRLFTRPARRTNHPMPQRKPHILPGRTLEIWVRRSVSLVKGRGCVTFIHLADALPALLAAMEPRLGGLEILPLAPRADAPAKRILVRGWRDSRAPVKLLPPLVLHGSDGSYTPAVEDVLRHGAALDWGKTG